MLKRDRMRWLWSRKCKFNEHILYMFTNLRFRISGHNNFHGARLPRSNPRVFEEFWEFWRNVTGDDRLLCAVWCLDQSRLHHVLVCTLLYDQRCITFRRSGSVCCAGPCNCRRLLWKLQELSNYEAPSRMKAAMNNLKYVTPWWQLESRNMSRYVTICHDMSRYVMICHDILSKELEMWIEPGNQRTTESGSCLDTI